MSQEFSELHIRKLSIHEDLTDDEGQGEPHPFRRRRKKDPGSHPVQEHELSKLQRRKLRLQKMGQKAASLKFSASDFVALSPDKLKQHYTIGKLLHRGGGGGGGATSTKSGRISMSRPSPTKHQHALHHSNSAHSTPSAASPHANVHECLHISSGIQRAVKVVKKSTRWNHRRNQRIRKEFQILQALDHPSLVRVYEFFEGKDHYYIIMDLCPGGDLCQELDAWGRLQEEDAAMLLKQVLSCLSCCHTHHIVHGNVKPEHILLEHDKDLDHIKLTDFSCADIHTELITDASQQSDDDNDNSNIDMESIFTSDQDTSSSSDEDVDDDKETAGTSAQSSSQQQLRSSNILPERLGTPDYWAPEVVLKGSTGTKRDIWACGVLCYLVLSNQFPFHGNSREEICERIIRGEFSFRGVGESRDSAESSADEESQDDPYSSYEDLDANSFYSDFLDGEAPVDITFSWKDVSDQAKSFIKLLLTYEEENRPTAREALKHPWIVEMTSPAIQKARQSGSRFSTTVPATAEKDAMHASTNSLGFKRSNDHDFVNSMATMAAWHNVAKFNASSKLKQATLTFIAAQMVLKEERKAIDHIFRTLDIYKDGRLSRKEVQIGYKEVFQRELTEEELDDLFERVDLNQSGFLEYSEFLVAAMNESDLLHRQKIQQAFSVFDRDGSGTISKEDLKGVLSHFKGGEEKRQSLQNPNQRFNKDKFQDYIDDEAIDKILKQADSSGDGQITYEDFMAMMLKTTDESDDESVQHEDEDEEEEDITPLTPPKRGKLSRGTTNGTIDSALSAENMKTLRFTTHDFVAKRHGELTDFYFIEDFIDEGGFGKVYVCRHKATNAERALKVIDKSRWRKEDNAKILNEFELLKGLTHPNIIKFFDLYQDKTHFYIVMSICKGGDLCDELDAWGKLSEANAAILMKQVLSCMNYIHEKKIIHRDMKPDNILLEQSKDFRQVKIIDFGFATHFEDGVEMTERAGTTEYMAPEVIQKSYYGSSCDMWSVGVICYLILSDKFPFKEKSREELYMSIVSGKYSFPATIWGSVSDEAKDFIEQLLTIEPDQRPTAEKALQHPWLADARRVRASVALASTPSDEVKAIVDADDSTRYALTNLQNFKKSRLQEAVKTFIASQLLLAEEKKAIEVVFRDLDITCNGKLSKSEVQAAYFKFFGHSLSQEELDSLFERVDSQGTGFIEYGDFVVATMNEKVLLGRNKLRKAFELFDDDGNGLITASDLKKALTLYGQNADIVDDDGSIKRLIHQVDEDGDGKISYDEFVGAMMLSTEEDSSDSTAAR